jgi:hypothetical protein
LSAKRESREFVPPPVLHKFLEQAGEKAGKNRAGEAEKQQSMS